MPALRYRRVPEEVEAFLYNGENVEEVMEWAAGKKMNWSTKKALREAPLLGDDRDLSIMEGVGKDREEVALGRPGDFIVKSPDGRFRRMGYNDFRLWYEPIT